MMKVSDRSKLRIYKYMIGHFIRRGDLGECDVFLDWESKHPTKDLIDALEGYVEENHRGYQLRHTTCFGWQLLLRIKSIS